MFAKTRKGTTQYKGKSEKRNLEILHIGESITAPLVCIYRVSGPSHVWEVMM